MENKKEIKLNVSYNEFIGDLIKSKLNGDNKEVDIIKEKYKNIVKLRFNNLSRVYKRNLREENKEKLSRELKRLNINERDFINMSNKVVELSREVKVSNYI